VGHIKHSDPVTPHAENSHSMNFLSEDLLLLPYIKQKRAYYTIEVLETSMAFQQVKLVFSMCKLLGKGFLKYVPPVGQLYHQ
jgi:hypothetical protein